MKNYKVIFLDLDGTLIDSKNGIFESITYALRKMSIQATNFDIHSFLGPALDSQVKTYFSLSDEETQVFMKHYGYFYEKFGIHNSSLYKGVADFLRRPYPFIKILVTLKPKEYAEKILTNHLIHRDFQGVYGNKLGQPSVSKAKILQRALEKVSDHGKVKPEQMIMIGDSKFDILAAKSNGIDSVFVTYGYGSLEEGQSLSPTYIVGDIDSLTGLLTKGVKSEVSS